MSDSDETAPKVAKVSLERRKHVTPGEQARAGAMHAAGAPVRQIASALDVSESAARRAIASPVAQGVAAVVLRDTIHAAKAQLADGAERAALRLVELVESDRDDTALRAANSVLDRVGVGATSTVKHVRELSADELQAQYAEAVARLRAAGELP